MRQFTKDAHVRDEQSQKRSFDYMPANPPFGVEWEQLVVSKQFDDEDFGYHKITVERPLRLNFHATPERLARLEDETAFKNLATSTKKFEASRLVDNAAGEKRQQQIRDLLAAFAKRHPKQINDRKVFLDSLKPVDRELNVRLSDCAGTQGRGQRPLVAR